MDVNLITTVLIGVDQGVKSFSDKHELQGSPDSISLQPSIVSTIDYCTPLRSVCISHQLLFEC